MTGRSGGGIFTIEKLEIQKSEENKTATILFRPRKRGDESLQISINGDIKILLGIIKHIGITLANESIRSDFKDIRELIGEHTEC